MNESTMVYMSGRAKLSARRLECERNDMLATYLPIPLGTVLLLSTRIRATCVFSATI